MLRTAARTMRAWSTHHWLQERLLWLDGQQELRLEIVALERNRPGAVQTTHRDVIREPEAVLRELERLGARSKACCVGGPSQEMCLRDRQCTDLSSPPRSYSRREQPVCVTGQTVILPVPIPAATRERWRLTDRSASTNAFRSAKLLCEAALPLPQTMTTSQSRCI